MNENAVAKAIVTGLGLIAVSIVLGCFIISRAPRFEKFSPYEVIDVRSGRIYQQTRLTSDGQPKYIRILGPLEPGMQVEAE